MDLDHLRVLVYEKFARTGIAPSRERLAELTGADGATVEDGIRRLADARLLVLDDAGAIVMAHPFASVNLGFSVMTETTLYWGGCAWDAFAIPHLVPGASPALVATRCPACGTAHAWSVSKDAPPEGDQVAHFLVPVERMWADVVHTCGHQQLFCSRTCVEAWLERTGHEPGSVMDLATLWRLARGWYAGRMEPGYVRREPAEAAEYFRSVGLSGSFWGI